MSGVTSKLTVKELIDRMVRRIVRKFRPNKVILFGSHARGEAGFDSDVDLLIVMPVQGSKREKRIAIRLALHDIELAKDIRISTPEEFERRKDMAGSIEYSASREGKVLYAQRGRVAGASGAVG
jgi:predicted nucleotidyltransferase